MGKVRSALAGVAVSGGLVAGAYLFDTIERQNSREDAELCIDAFEGSERADCIDKAEGDVGIPEIVALIGLVGIASTGYLSYKAIKDEVGTTGLIDDYL